MKTIALIIAVGTSLAFAGVAKAQLSVTSGFSSASTAGSLTLTNFQDLANPFDAILGDNIGGTGHQVVSQPYGSGAPGWSVGANNFTLTYNPTLTAQLSSSSAAYAGYNPLSIGTTFSNPVNYVQFSLFSRSSTSPGYSVSNLEITSLDGLTTYLSPTTLTIGAGPSQSQNNQVIDTAGLLANGFTISGTLNLTGPLSNYSSNQNDKFNVVLGYDAAAAPEPSSWALGLIAVGAVMYLRRRAVRA